MRKPSPSGKTAESYKRLLREYEAWARNTDREQQERRRQYQPDLDRALRDAEAGIADGMRRTIAVLAVREGIAIEVREQMPKGAAAFARWRKREIVIPPVRDAKTFAIALHEIGHILAGECTGKEPHRPDRSVREWHHCLACEREAWQRAMALATFSRGMHAELRRGLRSYRRSTPASDAEIERLDQVAGTVSWAEHVTKRRTFAEMESWVSAQKSDLERRKHNDTRTSY